MSSVKNLPVEFEDKLLGIGITKDEIAILQAWRYIRFGHITVYKKDGVKAGRIDIKTTY